MSQCELISVLISPLIATALFLLLKYKYPNGQFRLVYKSFFAGAAGVILVFFADRAIEILGLDSLHSVNRTLFYAFVLTTGLYEFYKALILRFMVYKSNMVRRPVDMVLYTIFIFTGFNASFSVYRIFFGAQYVNDCLYTYSVGPAVLSLAVIMGYFVGQARNRRFDYVDFFTALVITIVCHGLYYFSILTSDLPLLYLSIASMVVIASVLGILILKQRDDLYEPENFAG